MYESVQNEKYAAQGAMLGYAQSIKEATKARLDVALDDLASAISSASDVAANVSSRVERVCRPSAPEPASTMGQAARAGGGSVVMQIDEMTSRVRSIIGQLQSTVNRLEV